jgi:hypothetical protein
VILSGTIDGRKILVFDWTTMSYTLQAVQLHGNRYGGTCALLRGKERKRKRQNERMTTFISVKCIS